MNRIFIFALAVSTLSACRKSQSLAVEEPTTFSPTPALSAKINGTPWEASSMDGSVNHNHNGNSVEFDFQGWEQSDDKTVYISLANYEDKPGTYQVGGTNKSYAFYEEGHKNTFYASSGTVTIVNALPERIQGKYDFVTAKDYHIVGTFTISPNR